MERRPHKSGWKRKKRIETEGEKREESPYLDPDLRETLNKVKRYTLVIVLLMVVPTLIYLFVWGVMLVYIPFVCLAATFIAVFLIYFPISDALKKTEAK
ncbi:MAG: hypothetical protein HWN65_00875 [Candidatus Helarchaeota archaeon]|nr:hypothetical protein [Candidatus Helarchaeota archaeon]